MEFLNNYLNNLAQSPKERYKSFNQAVVDSRWEDTTQIHIVKEQKALPFTDEFDEFEAWVDSVSEVSVNTSKVYSDFVEILPKDIDHKDNYRGQYYKLAIDGEHEETYLCYDRISPLAQLPNFKCVRCNNILTWINDDNKIVAYPCYLGTDISSTNDFVSKAGITPNSRMVIYVQANDDTKSIVNNQRFMFEHNSTFEIEEINNYMQEQGTDGEVTLIRIYLKYSPMLPTDNKELNLCDYYNREDSIKKDIDSTVKTLVIDPYIKSLKKGKSHEFKCSVLKNNNPIEQPIACECNWIDNNYYILEQTIDGFKITNKNICSKPLILTFKSQDCEDIDMTINLVGVI